MFLVEKKIDKNDFEKSLHFEGGGGGGAKANLEKVYILNFFFYDGFPKGVSVQCSVAGQVS